MTSTPNTPASERVPEMVERVALAIAIDGGCGLTIEGKRALCDHPRSIQPAQHCDCRSAARAAIAAIRDHLAENFSMDKSAITLLDEALR